MHTVDLFPVFSNGRIWKNCGCGGGDGDPETAVKKLKVLNTHSWNVWQNQHFLVQQFPRVTRTPAEPRGETPQNPRRDPAERSERPPQSPLRGKLPRRASRRVVPLGWWPSGTLESGQTLWTFYESDSAGAGRVPGLGAVLKSPWNPQNCIKQGEILARTLLFSAPNSGMRRILVQKRSDILVCQTLDTKRGAGLLRRQMRMLTLEVVLGVPQPCPPCNCRGDPLETKTKGNWALAPEKYLARNDPEGFFFEDL